MALRHQLLEQFFVAGQRHTRKVAPQEVGIAHAVAGGVEHGVEVGQRVLGRDGATLGGREVGHKLVGEVGAALGGGLVEEIL